MGNAATHCKEVFQTNEPPTTEPESPMLCDPVQNLIDPRSPTVQFHRTPIEVVGLPIKNRSRITSTQLVESPDPTARGSYFSANVITKSSEEAEATSKLRRLRFLSDDPRSPSVGIVRTPIEVESTPEDVYHKINQEVFSPTDTVVTATSMEDLLAPDSSPRTAANTPTACFPHQRTSSTSFAHTPIQLEGQSHSSNHETIDPSVTCISDCNMEEPVDVTTSVSRKLKPAVESVVPANLNKTNGDCLARKLFGTPDSKELLMQVHLKARTPLKIVSANEISPQKILRVKHAQGINHEAGLFSGIENTPPDTLNKYDSLTKNKQLTKSNKSQDCIWDSTTTI